MGSGWSWCAAYVQIESEKQVAQAIQDTLKLETKGNIQQFLKEIPNNWHLGGGSPLFVCTSPEENGWVAVWHISEVFFSWVFKRQGLSGLILGGHGEAPSEFLADPFYDSSWMYIVWEKGQIIDWFVKEPEIEFAHWESKSMRGLVLPYLSSKGIAINIPEVPFGGMFEFIIQNSQAFSRNPAHIRPFVHHSLKETEIVNWLGLPAGQALYKSSEILDISFVGPEFFISDIGNFLDIQRGLAVPYPFINYLEPGVKDRRERDENWKQVVATFNPYMMKVRSNFYKMQSDDYNDLNFLFDCLI